jgi:hypothetical protein
MVTVAHVVKKIIRDKPFIEEAIFLNIINYGGLADLIIPEIEEELGKKATHASVMMAIRRYAEQLDKKEFSRNILEYINDINVRSNLLRLQYTKQGNQKNSSRNTQTFPGLQKGRFLINNNRNA